MQMPRRFPFLATVGPLSIVTLDTGVIEFLLRETDLKRSMMMCNCCLLFHFGGICVSLWSQEFGGAREARL